MKKKYYLYAGYYKLYITDKLLRRPYTLLSTHRSFPAAWKAAEKKDPEEGVFVDMSLRNDSTALFHMASNAMPVFDGKSRSIENGLSDYTLDRAFDTPDCQPTAQCLTDYTHLLHVKGGLSLRRSRSLCQGKTYRQLDELLKKYIPA